VLGPEHASGRANATPLTTSLRTMPGLLDGDPSFLRDLRLDPFTVRAAAVLGDLLLEAGDRLRGRLGRRLPELVARPRGLWVARHGFASPRLPVYARTSATIRAATSTKKTMERSVAISTTGVPAG